MKFIERFLRQPGKQVQPVEPGAAPLLMALEPRIMFDASVGVVAEDAAQAASEPAADGTSKDSVAKDTTSATADTRSTQSTQTSQRQEVVFVDGQVGNVQQLLAGLPGNAEIVLLDPAKDGLQQMAEYLRGREGIDAVHLLSHGADGTVQVGNVWLASSNLAEHRAALESIGAALKADGDLMIYGCRVGDSSKGQAFIDNLASITGADVAASSDDTGAAGLSGNWTLERSSGAIETTALALDSYEGVLVASWSTSSAAPLGTLIGVPGRTVVGDFDGDGDADIFYQTGINGSSWEYALNNGDGTFTPIFHAASPFTGLSLPDHTGTNYFVADFDGDGDMDLLAGVNNGQGRYFYNHNGGFFERNASLPTLTVGSRMVVGDFDGDGDADILYQSGSSGSLWGYARSNGDGTFTLLSQADSPFSGLTLKDHAGNNYFVADFDGDGDLDVLATVASQPGVFLRNNGQGTFSSLSTAGFTAPLAAGRVSVGDFDGDGDADILYQTGSNGTAFEFARSNGDGTFTLTSIGASPFAGLSLIDHSGSNYRVGDFDGDGDLDILTAAAGSRGTIYLQNGAAPELLSTTPVDNYTNVSPTANIILTFTESVSKGTGNIYIVRTSDNEIVETIAIGSGQVTGSGTTWTIDPSITLGAGVSYAVRIDPKVFVDADGTVFKGISNNTTLNFTTGVAQPPVISNLNGDSVTFTEGTSGTLLDAGSNAIVTDADSVNFNGGNVTVTISNNGQASQDVLWIKTDGSISTSGNNVLYGGVVIGTYAGGTLGSPLVISLNSAATPAAVSGLLRNLSYRNTDLDNPNTATRTVQITVNDGAGGTSSVASVSVNVAAVNDAPVVSVVGSTVTYTEGSSAVQLFSGASFNTVESGQSINQIVFTVTNRSNGSSEKLVIDGTAVALIDGTNVITSGNGTSVQVSVSGTTATVTMNHAGLSAAQAQVLLNNMGYRNDSQAPSGSPRVVTIETVRDNGGVSNGGVDTRVVGVSSTVNVAGANDAPTLSGGPYVMTGVNEDTTTSGYLVSSVLGGVTYADEDPGALIGIAVTATTGRGTWQYSTDGSIWTDFGPVSSSSALLLSATSQVRYIPDGVSGENVNFTFRGWDRTAGTESSTGSRSLGDTTTNGASTAYSTGTAQATLVVTSVNDAPVLTPVSPTLPPLSDISTTNTGSLVSVLTGGITDVDTGAVKGVAITGLTFTYGTWEYTTNGGATWTSIGIVSEASALILRSNDRIRFVPDGLHGETATITYKAWDQTGGTAGFQGAKLNTNTSGGISPYSAATDTASVVVTASNDAPTLNGTAGNVTWTEGNNTTSLPVVIDSGLTITDADGPLIASATVRVSGNYSNGQDYLELISNPATMGNITASWDATNGTLTLTSAGNQATMAQFQAALRAVTYTNLSDAPSTSARTVQFQVNDGSLDSSAVSRNIVITAVDDSPVITAPANTVVVEDIASVISLISVSDSDSSSGTVTLSVGSGSLAATSAAGVTVGGTSSALTLSGTLAAINSFIANNRLSYTTATNATADVTLTIAVDTGSVSTDTKTVTLTVSPVNDAPVITVPASIDVTEDVSGYITGVSFSDIDAGSGNVTATFSVASGNLTAASANNVVVGGSGTGTLTLSGTISDINAFIAGNNLSYKTALNATASVTLTVTLNDNGNTGGSPQSDTKSVTINVTEVNDAPVNSVPAAQTAQQGIPLAFNDANGNAISISDVDAGSSLIVVTLSASNGTLSLGNTSGVTLLLGSGTNDSLIRLEGTQANINAVLQSLTFKSNTGFLGSANLTVQTNDQGNSGSGGGKADIDTIAISVIPLNPKVTSVSAQGPDRTVKVGDEVLVNVVFDQAVNVDLSGGVPSLLLETGLLDRNAIYQSGSGSNTLVFKYTVQAGDVSADLDFQSTAALQLNGAVLANATNDLAILTLPTVGGADSLGGRSNIVVDGVVPVVASVSVPSGGTYITGQNLDFTVNFSESVIVDSSGGVPRIAVTLDSGGTVYADYVSGSGGSALVFRLTVASGQLDSNGITLGGTVQLNGGSIRDGAGNDTVVTLNSVASTANVNVDGVVPAVVSVNTPSDGHYKAGDVLTFTVNASEALQTGALPPRLVLDVGGVTRYATYVSGNGSNALVFQYIVQAGDNDGNGIAVNTIDLRGEPLTDLAGNNMNLTLSSVGSTAGVLVDTVAPSPTGIVTVDPSPTNSGSVSFTVTFDEDVSGVDTGDFVLALSGTANGTITSASRVDGRTWTVVVGNLSGVGSLGLNLNGSGTGIVDAANNSITGGLTGATYAIDRVPPSVTSVVVPSSGTYVAGQNLDFTVHLSEAVQVDTTGGTPRIEVTLDTGGTAYATYLSGAGTNALVFRLTVTSGQLDATGISVGNSIQLNGGAVRDSIGNNVVAALNGLPDTSQVRIDAIVPTVTTVGLPATGAYNAGDVLRFTVNVSETVNVDTSTGTPRVVLDIGGVTRYANYVSGSGSNALVFEYTVQAGNNAADGIGLAGTLDLNGGTVRDAAGNPLNLALNAPGTAGGVVIDTVAPQVSAIVRVDPSPTNSGSVRYTVTFEESVAGVDSADFSLLFSGSASGRIASVEQVNGRTYTILVDNLAGVGNVRLDLNSSATGIVDVAGNPITGGLEGSSYSIDRVAPIVTGVDVPASGTYVAGQTLDFTVRTDEAVLVDNGNGNPRLAITLDDGRVVYAEYLSGSGGTALQFRLNVTSGMSGNTTFAVAQSIDLNGGSIRDAVGNDANAGLNNVGDTRGILVDAKAPRPSSIVVDGPVQPTDRTLNFTLTFDEAVSGVDLNDFSVIGTGGASGTVQSVQQIDAKTYRITVGSMSGAGSLRLSLNALNSGIRDQAGNDLVVSLVGQPHALQPQSVGDLNYRLNPPDTFNAPQTSVLQPQVPGFVATDAVSPLAAPGLFDVRTVGGSLQPLGTIFLGTGGSAPSFIAQVFGSSDSGIGGGQGGVAGEGSVFGSSTFAGIFSRDVPGVSEMNVFNGSQWKQSDLNQGLRGVFGAPTFGQQLHQINEADQRHVRELAMALAQPVQIGKRA